MSYRINEEKHEHKGNRTIEKTITPATFYITNGQEARLAFPCWYKEVFPPIPVQHHCRDWHDHIGWPSPNHPDHICQHWDFASHVCHHHGHKDFCHHCDDFIDLSKLWPIHLIKEGYEDVTVQVGESIPGLKAKGSIDEKRDWIVRVWFSAMIPNLEKPYETKLAVRIHNEKLKKTDTVFLGKLIVLPAAMVTLPTGD